MAQNPNINFTSGSNIINVNGTIVNASKFVGDPLTYSAGKPVDPNSKDPLIKRLNYTINSDTGQVQYVDTGNGNATFNSLNDYAQSHAINFAGYDAFTTQNIQYAMQKNLASAIGAQGPTGGPPVAPSGGGSGDTVADLFKQVRIDVGFLNITDLKLEFGKVDEAIKINVQYPLGALYDNTQDHFLISQYKYKPPRREDFFPTGNNTPVTILYNGSTRSSALKELLGTVKLPMPNNISDSNNVSWGDDNINNLSAAIAAQVLKSPATTALGGAGLQLGANFAGLGGGIAKTATMMGILAAMGIDKNKLSQSGAGNLIATTLNSQILAMSGVNVSPESILARGYGVVPNSNLELLFNAPTLREFTFQYRMSPRSKEEARIINKIIRFFKQGMAAKKQNGKAGAASYFLGTPNVFQLQYNTSGGRPIKGVNRFKTCALTGFAMNYAADGNWAAYDEGQPVSVIMNMSFKELEPVYDTDYQSSINESRLTNNNQLQDLYPVSDDEVGY